MQRSLISILICCLIYIPCVKSEPGSDPKASSTSPKPPGQTPMTSAQPAVIHLSESEKEKLQKLMGNGFDSKKPGCGWAFLAMAGVIALSLVGGSIFLYVNYRGNDSANDKESIDREETPEDSMQLNLPPSQSKPALRDGAKEKPAAPRGKRELLEEPGDEREGKQGIESKQSLLKELMQSALTPSLKSKPKAKDEASEEPQVPRGKGTSGDTTENTTENLKGAKQN